MDNNLVLSNARGLENEPEVYDFINSLPINSVFYDLGSCVGGFALHACYKGLKTVAFEVESLNYNEIIHNYEFNKHLLPKDHYFKSIQIGIADKKGTTSLRIGQNDPGGHHKTLELDDYCASFNIVGDKIEQVKINTLDNLIKEYKLPQPEYLKVDIDGSEYAFIQGAKNTLKQVKSLIIELLSYEQMYFPKIVKELEILGLKETSRGNIIDEHGLCNIVFTRIQDVD